MKEAIEIAANEMHIKELDEWKSVTALQLHSLGLKTLVDKNGLVLDVLFS